MRPRIDKDLLPMKAHYFFFNAGTAPVVPFMPTLAKQLGYSNVVVGTMYAILPVIGMLAKPLCGFIADRYQRHRTLFIAAEILTAVAFFAIMFTPAIPQQLPSVTFHCHAGEANFHFCTEDQCTINEIERDYQDKALACKLTCPTQAFMWDIICQDWNTTGLCPPANNTANIDISATFTNLLVERNETTNEGCMFFSVPHIKAEVNGHNATMYCPKDKPYFSTLCSMDCNDTYLDGKIADSPVISTKAAMGLYQFWWFFGMLIISWIGMAAVVSIGDAICFGILGERAHLYGKQRLYGSVGWGIFSILAGVLVDKMSNGVEKDYTIVFWMTAVLIGLDVVASMKLKHTQTHLSPNIVKDVGQMFLSVHCLIFFIWCIFIGLGTALIWNFLFVHLESLGGCDATYMKTLQGFVMSIQCFCGELPFFFFSGWILKKIGHVNAMSMVLFGFGVRFILYSMLQDPWYALPIELLNGVTFGLFYATMASYASIVAPPGTETTMQGLVGAIFEGVGVSLGSLIAGYLFDSIGGGHTFEIFGVAAFVAFIVHVCLQMYLQRHHSSSDENGKQIDDTNPTAENATLKEDNNVDVESSVKTSTPNEDGHNNS
ncbi:sugar baby transporter isoform X1 [Musca autumnalis]|uniref:sugar baby transporter isoform X1 n=1 Tax=Musca autumnalis TaxID=221902 RepID=UPI003CF4B69C